MLSSNQYYGGLNRRFDQRAKRLASVGYRYERIEAYGIAVFCRNTDYERKLRTIPASAVMHADRRSWIDLLKQNLKSGIAYRVADR